MPLEIRELHIRITVNEHDQEAPSTVERDEDQENAEMMDRESIVAECVEQVLGILNKRRER